MAIKGVVETDVNKQLQKVNNNAKNMETKINNTYDGMIKDSDKYYNDLNKQIGTWADTQTKLQNEQTEHTINMIEQNKQRTERDYTKEQTGAYTDWQKQANAYGVNAEQLASQGLANTGYSESSQVAMYNTYQNRVATARQTFQDAITDYDNQITTARLQNNSILAEIANNALMQQLGIALESVQYKNGLLTEKLGLIIDNNNNLWNQRMDLFGLREQKNSRITDNYWKNKNFNYQESRDKVADSQWKQEFNENKRQFNAKNALDWYNSKNSGSSGSGSSGNQGVKVSGGDNKVKNNNKKSNTTTNKKTTGQKVLDTVKGVIKTVTGKNEVNTRYYSGPKNKDCKYGTFSNGYQPNNVNGRKLSKTGDVVNITTCTRSGHKEVVQQNIWKDTKGNKYVWNGRKNKYERYSGGK